MVLGTLINHTQVNHNHFISVHSLNKPKGKNDLNLSQNKHAHSNITTAHKSFLTFTLGSSAVEHIKNP
ncbi:CLUMA_CG006338, isoform A [Clunio marinus]|uniref:CLUMA_CG006338, isoform A n=1 Tax=Clunio marinus TaxID=568069 RepID=A0A1J1HXD5_9DIPT|nr:CLUMA_CG006416, isoform A [Clunio marinus]CRK92736.1 CLUMA_CG006338, isoform A [Clunio marinus]